MDAYATIQEARQPVKHFHASVESATSRPTAQLRIRGHFNPPKRDGIN
jgi:hypothetical protein